MNKEYVMLKLAKEFSAIETGVLEPQSEIQNAVGGGIAGGLLGGSIGALTLPNSMDKLEKSEIIAKILKRVGVGAAIGAPSIALLAYLATKEDNDLKKADPTKYLTDFGKELRFHR